MRYIEELDTSSQEFKKALEVVKLLTTPPQKKSAQVGNILSSLNSAGYGLSVDSRDKRGYNIMHTLALHSSI